MGIRGFQSYVVENGFFVGHRLQDTKLVIDGMNLEYELYSRFLLLHGDIAYGGDYASLAVYIESFFKALAKCNITPVVIMDGSFEDDKRGLKLERWDERLKTAKAIYESRSTGGEEVNSLLNTYVFVQVVKKLKIAVYKSILEADDILPSVAVDLGAPILSGDSDFLLENVPAGVIITKNLVASGFKVQTDSERPYLKCEMYRLSSLLAKFPGLQATLVPIGGAILGNDYFDFQEAKNVINKLPKDRNFRHSKFRVVQIHTVFSWLASQYTPASAKAYLQQICGVNHRIVQCIENRFMGPPLQATPLPPNQSIEEYFKDNFKRLFKQEPGFPDWAHGCYVEEKLHKRAISIFRGKVDFFNPLVEDFSLDDSTYQTVFELCECIYGILRSDETNPKMVDQYVRVGQRRENRKVMPKTEIGNKRLPVLADIATMSREDRVALFYNILGLNPTLSDDLDEVINLSDIKLSSGARNQLLILFLSTIYMSHHFSSDLWLEFLYALMANILMMGHFSEDDSIPNVVDMDAADHKKLVSSLSAFDRIPDQTRGYKARIVHQYNTFQNCLNNVTFLAMTLDLADVYHTDTLVCGLQGTLIYNMTLALTNEATPLSYLIKSIFQYDCRPVTRFGCRFNRLVLTNSARTFIGTIVSTGGDDGGEVLPSPDIVPVISSAFEKKSSGEKYLVRGGDCQGLSNLGNLASALGSVNYYYDSDSSWEDYDLND